MMAYKFWAHQTGRGCIPRHADIPELQKRLARFLAQNERLERETSNEVQALGAFLDALDAHQEAYAEMYDEIRVPGKRKKAPIAKSRVQGPVKKFDHIKD